MTDEIYEEVMWSPWTDVGLEYLCMAGGQGGVTATGLVMRMPGLPWGFRYVVNLERRWLMRRIAFEPLDRPGWPLHLEEDGTWRTAHSNELRLLSGCLDVDLSVTPLTNTLILRRLDLAVGESAEVCVGYVTAPELRLERREQRYSRTGAMIYRLEETRGDSEFEVDDAGLVLDWPGRYRRVWSLDKEERRLDLERQVAQRERLLLERERDA